VPRWSRLRALAALASAAIIPLTLRPTGPDFERDVVPFLKKHCLECHEGPEAEEGFDLGVQLDESTARAAFDDWDYMRERVLDGEMPPRSQPQPGGAEVESFLGWIDAAHGPVDLRFRPLDPGRPVLRRLNAREYANTVRALCGVEFQAEDFFPADAVGFGFDHIGASLSLPDALFEKYLQAAEQIADEAIVRWQEADAAPRRFGASDLEGGNDRNGAVRGLYTRSATSANLHLRHSGIYSVTIEAYGQQAGPDPCQMALSINRRIVENFEVKETRKAPGTFTATVSLEAGPVQLSAGFVNDYYVEGEADRNLYIQSISIEGPADPPLPTLFQALLFSQYPESLGKKRLDAILGDLMERAWRRPVSRAEIKRLEKSLPQDSGLAALVHQALVTVLVTPRFLFRFEADEALLDAELEQAIFASFTSERPLREQVRALDDWELATRLAYFLTSAPPDAILRARAAAGQLTSGSSESSAVEVLRGEVDRLLQTPASRSFVRNFAGQWLQLRNLDRIAIDTERFPEWNIELREAMKLESYLLFEAVLREDRDVRELLDADFTFVNQELAEHYGIDEVQGKEHRRVSLASGRRAGLLGHASVLTITSNPARTSPVKRGKWILENLLGAPPPPPPADAGALDESKLVSASSLREQLAEHRARPDCAVCHDAMDPLGLGLENFGPIGNWREQDQGGAIDSSGILPDGSSFAGATELRALLRNDPAFVRTVSERLLVYALGRGLERSDRATVQGVLAGLKPDQPTLRAILHGIVESPAFRLRRTAP
jgi:uncharacterized protein DUF1592/uncharacterized protein DUF1588/uncharacterized protein DUF1587/uncharacterized protein DUF1585/predicted xylan-binding protein with Ca-dependent carbohydrate-binding module/uncharacterized protein DUF1595